MLSINHTLKISYVNATTRFFRKQDSITATFIATSKACVDERGVDKQVEGTRRGSPADFWKLAEASEGLLFIATR